MGELGSSFNMWRQKAKLETSIYTNVYKDTTNRLYGIWNLLLRWPFNRNKKCPNIRPKVILKMILA